MRRDPPPTSRGSWDRHLSYQSVFKEPNPPTLMFISVLLSFQLILFSHSCSFFFFFAFLINVCGNRCRDDCSEPNTGWGHMCMLTNSHTWNTQLKISFFYAKFNFASTSVPVCISRWWGQWCHRYLGQKNVMCCRHSTGFNIHKLFNINYSNKNTNS